jgi:hypothetical protein
MVSLYIEKSSKNNRLFKVSIIIKLTSFIMIDTMR